MDVKMGVYIDYSFITFPRQKTYENVQMCILQGALMLK